MVVRGVVLAVGRAGWSGIHLAGGAASALSSTWEQFGSRKKPDIWCRCQYHFRPNTGAERADENRTTAADILFFWVIIRSVHRCACLSTCRSGAGRSTCGLGGWGLEARRLFACSLVSSGFASSSTVGAIGWWWSRPSCGGRRPSLLQRCVLMGLGRSRVLGDHGRRSVRGSLTAGAGTSYCL
jgi:hypothetical protein